MTDKELLSEAMRIIKKDHFLSLLGDWASKYKKRDTSQQSKPKP